MKPNPKTRTKPADKNRPARIDAFACAALTGLLAGRKEGDDLLKVTTQAYTIAVQMDGVRSTIAISELR